MQDVMEVGFDAQSVSRVFDMMTWGLTDAVVGRSAKPGNDRSSEIADRRSQRVARAASSARAELARIDRERQQVHQARRARITQVTRMARAGLVAGVSGVFIYALASAGVAKLDDPPKKVTPVESAPVIIEGAGSSVDGFDDPNGLVG